MLRAAGEAQHFSRKDQGIVIYTTVALTVGLLWQVEYVMTKTRAQDWQRPDRAYSILTLFGECDQNENSLMWCELPASARCYRSFNCRHVLDMA